MRYTVLSLIMVSLLAGCSTPSVDRVVYQKLVPPATLLLPCPEPTLPEVVTNGVLATYAQDLTEALGSCNDDKAALREFVKD